MNTKTHKFSLRPNIYFHVKDWMIHKLKLNGSLLTTFAFIFDCSCNQLKVEEEDLCNIFAIEPRTARYRFKKLYDKGYIQREKKSSEIASKYVYWIDVDKIYKLVF